MSVQQDMISDPYKVVGTLRPDLYRRACEIGHIPLLAVPPRLEAPEQRDRRQRLAATVEAAVMELLQAVLEEDR